MRTALCPCCDKLAHVNPTMTCQSCENPLPPATRYVQYRQPASVAWGSAIAAMLPFAGGMGAVGAADAVGPQAALSLGATTIVSTVLMFLLIAIAKHLYNLNYRHRIAEVERQMKARE